MMDLFFRDPVVNTDATWDNLIMDLNNSTSFNPYFSSNSYYEIFRHLILSLLLGEKIVLLDNDWSAEEREKITGARDYSRFSTPIADLSSLKITSKAELITRVSNTSPNWSVTLFTSGTTGVPHKVEHTFGALTRFVKIRDTKSSDVWGFTYSPTHIAGLEVFFQALLNGNTVIRLIGLTKNQIYAEIGSANITCISATPTFWRLMVPFTESFPLVTRITSGGEMFDTNTADQLRKIFPNARFTNVYASTEAGTLLASEGGVFTVRPGMQDFIRIENGELLVHRSLVGSFRFEGDQWYKTGDLVEVISQDPIRFRFLARKDTTINVGGFNVNPEEVEDALRGIPGILDARVYPRKNAVSGNIICSEVIRSDESLTEQDIRFNLETRMQNYKIPRIIHFVVRLTETRTGKIKR